MADEIRLFIACEIPPLPVLNDVLRQLRAVGPPIRPVQEKNLHLTLRFLGDTDSGQLESITDIVRDVAAAHPAFDIELVGLGAFPTKQRASVIWAGIRNGDALISCEKQLSEALQPLGFTPDRYDYKPHLTLARIRRPRHGSNPSMHRVEALYEQHGHTEFGLCRIDALTLFRSDSTPDGPRYTALERAPLG